MQYISYESFNTNTLKLDHHLLSWFTYDSQTLQVPLQKNMFTEIETILVDNSLRVLKPRIARESSNVGCYKLSNSVSN